MNLKHILRPAPHLERHPAQHALLVLLGAALALGATLGVVWAAGFDAVLDRLQHAHPAWLGLVCGAELIAYGGYAIAYRELVRVEGGPELGLRRAGAIVAAGFGVFVIRGGFIVDRHALESAGVPPREARVRVLGLGALEYAVLAPVACAAALVLLARGATHPSLGFTLPWAIAVPLGFVGAFAALPFRERVSAHGFFRSALRHALDALHILRRLAVERRRAFAGAALYWSADVTSLWAALRMFGERPPLAGLVIGYATGYALTRRTLPLGGAGSVEALVSFALAWTGIKLAPALLAVFAYRVFNLWLPLLPAALGLRTLKQLRRAAERTGAGSG